jgi:ribonuclease D
MAIHIHNYDLPRNLDLGKSIAIDTETMGLNPHRDRLCLVQLSSGDGDAHLVKIANPSADAPHLKALLADPKRGKLFHFARFDLAVLERNIGPIAGDIYCTKIASKLARTYTDRHGLRDLCREFLRIDISKQQQSSDWGAEKLTDDQADYAAGDVLYLHQIRAQLDTMLEREGRQHLAEACFAFIRTRTALDLGGFSDLDIFHH